ncbi:MAG: hypothetical protein ACRC80_16630, partial [Waterburya sp.]
NTFNVLAGFGDFVTLDIPGDADAEDPDLVIRLKTIKTLQGSSLTNPSANNAVEFQGTVDFITFGPSGQEIIAGTGSFSSTLPTVGQPGTAVLSFTVDDVKAPEASTVSALIGFGLLGSLAMKKKKTVA